MIKIGICDDLAEELQTREQMVRRITKKLCLNAQIKCFCSGEELLWEIEQTGNMDIVLMDIEMTGLNGVDTAKIIRETDYRVILIFMSYYDQYCKEMISVQPFAFLDKPVLERQLEEIFKRAQKALEEKEEVFEFSYKKVEHKIILKGIRYFESDKREVIINSMDQKYTFYSKLDDVEQRLEDTDVKFIRIGKSFLVNTNYIKEFRYEKIVMDDGEELRIGSKYKEKVREFYIEKMKGSE